MMAWAWEYSGGLASLTTSQRLWEWLFHETQVRWFGYWLPINALFVGPMAVWTLVFLGLVIRDLLKPVKP